MQEVQELQGKGLAAPGLEHPRGTAQTPAAAPTRGYRGQQQPIWVRRTLPSNLSYRTATTSCCGYRMICTAEKNLPLFCAPLAGVAHRHASRGRQQSARLLIGLQRLRPGCILYYFHFGLCRREQGPTKFVPSARDELHRP